jgi:hypothetical protein
MLRVVFDLLFVLALILPSSVVVIGLLLWLAPRRDHHVQRAAGAVNA